VLGVFSCGCCMIMYVVHRERSVFGRLYKKEEVFPGIGVFERSRIEVKNATII
jgi:hypothetical protein